MKQMSKWISAVVLVFVSVHSVSAQSVETAPTYSDGGNNQSNLKVNVMYNYSMPTGSFRNDFIKSNSPRGFNLDVLYMINPKWSVGGSTGYQDYYEKNARQTYKLADGSDISAVLSNSVQVMPIMAKAMFLPDLGTGSHIQPYAGLGAGINIIHFDEYLGQFNSLTNSSVGFAAEAGAGIKIPFGSSNRSGFLLGASYRFSPYNKYGINNLNTFNVQAGIQFTLSK